MIFRVKRGAADRARFLSSAAELHNDDNALDRLRRHDGDDAARTNGSGKNHHFTSLRAA